MLKTLIKAKLSAYFASFSGANSSKRKKPQSPVARALLIALFIFLALYLVVAFGFMAYGMDTISKQTGDFWLSQTLATMVASLLCIVGSVFTAKTQIFESKDNELLLSMPITPRDIFLSRIVMLLIVNYLLEAIILVPVIAVHIFVVGYSPLGALFTLLVFLLLPFITLSLSCLIAWVISAISSRLRNKTLVSVLFTVLFFIVYFVACGAFGGIVGASEDGASIDFTGLKSSYIFYWMGSAMGEGNALGFLYFALCTIVISVVTYILLNRSFIKIITTNKGVKKIAYVAKEEKTNSIGVALFKKEIKRFFSSSAYILNAGMGNIMTVIIAVVMIFVSSDVNATFGEIPEFARFVPVIASMIIVFMGSMNFVSAPSISLEDKSLWILQGAPIEPSKILFSKVLTHIAICAPCTLVSAVIIAIAFKFSVLNFIAIILASASIVAFTGYFGLLLGLKFPKFDWQNETVAVKQGFSVFGAMLGTMLWGMLFFIGGIGLAILSVDFYVSGLIFTLLNVIICAIIHMYFKKGGAIAFANLKH